jgi:hypothetical protein
LGKVVAVDTAKAHGRGKVGAKAVGLIYMLIRKIALLNPMKGDL